MVKRLFIFAGYDSDGIIDSALLHYIGALSGVGDVVFYMDNDASEFELAKLKAIPNVLHAAAQRHMEYDFGSYKRGLVWATENGILGDYDWVYFVNDSVYGPIRDLEPYLVGLEAKNTDIVGMYYATDGKRVSYVQSWFFGLGKNIAAMDWIAEFFNNVTHQNSKESIVAKYEVGFSVAARENNCSIKCFISGPSCQDSMRNPLRTLKQGMPFIKKNPFAIGGLGNEKNVAKYVNAEFLQKMVNSMNRNGLNFSKYKKLWDIRLFGILPLVSVFREKTGGAEKIKVFMFRYIKIFAIHSGFAIVAGLC
jgi:lipopolysaccharide biosynthesis protein